MKKTEKTKKPMTGKRIAKITGITLSAVIVLFVVISFVACKVLYSQMFGRVEERDYKCSVAFSPDDLGDMPKRAIEFESEGNTLRGYVFGEKSDKGLVVIAHGIGGVMNDYFPEMIYLVENGYQVMMYNCTGTATSDGDGTKSLAQSALDLHHALEYVESRYEFKGMSVYLFGHSWGGYAVTAVLNYDHDIAGVVSCAGYSDFNEMLLEYIDNFMGLPGYAEYPFAAFWQWTEVGDNMGLTGIGGINKSDVPVLIVQGGKDEMVFDASIYCNRDEITNPNVEYYFEPESGHNDIFESKIEREKSYRSEVDDEREALREQYRNNVPDDVLSGFISGIDKHLYNKPNADLMSRTCEFYEKCGK